MLKYNTVIRSQPSTNYAYVVLITYMSYYIILCHTYFTTHTILVIDQ
jgi:hypothetical protein